MSPKPSKKTIQPGLHSETRITVSEAETATQMSSGSVEVYATPALVALMESAAVKALEGYLSPGQTTVGGQIDVRHLAATPVGMRVRARAELTEVDGHKLTFHIQAWDEVEKIGEASHTRFIVNAEKFIEHVTNKRT